MRSWLRRHISYGNVTSTVALFLAVGGGAYAASGGLLSTRGDLRGCVNPHGGALYVVRAHSRCKRRSVAVEIATPASAELKGATGPRGPQGAPGPPGPGAFAFAMGPTSAEPNQTIASSFAGNQLRLACGGGRCRAELVIGGATHTVGIEDKGKENAAVSQSVAINSSSPADATIATIAGANSESQGSVTVELQSPHGAPPAWHVQVELLEDPLLNVRLIGTAVPATGTQPCVFPPVPQCPSS